MWGWMTNLYGRGICGHPFSRSSLASTQCDQTDRVSYYMGGAHERAVRLSSLGWFSSVSTLMVVISRGWKLVLFKVLSSRLLGFHWGLAGWPLTELLKRLSGRLSTSLEWVKLGSSEGFQVLQANIWSQVLFSACNAWSSVDYLLMAKPVSN